ncbi:hypothetical protein [Parasutterella excrementihominis]|uniref:hypothetical protein n=1 Tax=Parasutterella excrementihominis TaxID=487175 RepID=UPI002676330E|nr:hypothetical protein [Parasutterella excrementihominis]
MEFFVDNFIFSLFGEGISTVLSRVAKMRNWLIIARDPLWMRSGPLIESDTDASFGTIGYRILRTCEFGVELTHYFDNRTGRYFATVPFVADGKNKRYIVGCDSKGKLNLFCFFKVWMIGTDTAPYWLGQFFSYFPGSNTALSTIGAECLPRMVDISIFFHRMVEAARCRNNQVSVKDVPGEAEVETKVSDTVLDACSFVLQKLISEAIYLSWIRFGENLYSPHLMGIGIIGIPNHAPDRFIFQRLRHLKAPFSLLSKKFRGTNIFSRSKRGSQISEQLQKEDAVRWLKYFSMSSLRNASISMVATSIGLFFTVMALVLLVALVTVPTYGGIWVIHWLGLPLPL